VQKFDADGDEDNTYGVASKNDGSASGEAFQSIGDPALLAEFGYNDPAPTQIAVDNYPASPSYRNLYVASTNSLFGFKVHKFGPAGNYISTINVEGELLFPGALAVDHTTGNLYVGVIDIFGGSKVRVYDSTGAPLAPTQFSVTGFPYGIAVDGATEKVYVATGTKVETRSTATGALIAGSPLDSNAAKGVSIDPATGRIYVDEGNRLRVYSSSGTEIGLLGNGLFSQSMNLGAYGNTLYVSNRGAGNVAVFRPETQASDAYDHPLVIHSVDDSESRYTRDFQTTADGNHAVFPTVLPLTGFDGNGNYELFRYEALTDQFDCLPCNPTLQAPATDAALASDGLSITDDGRVFFNTGESLVLRDTNGVRDVYEWNEGAVELISGGQDRADSSLLTTSADGLDVYFFTRETFAANDRNGTVMKIYDAREEGGFFVIPTPPGCRASDECHGPGSSRPAPLVLGTFKGTRGNFTQKCDPKGLARRAKQLSKRATSIRRRARKASAGKAASLRRRAKRTATSAKRKAAAAKRCRQQSRSRR
jgi:hypothetical protein